MPLKSKAQQGWMFANKPEMAKEWAKETPNLKKLPERVSKGNAEEQADEGVVEERNPTPEGEEPLPLQHGRAYAEKEPVAARRRWWREVKWAIMHPDHRCRSGC